MLDVDKLATLHAVLDCGSFSAAAHRLRLTQPAVSRQVSLLERRLGVELVRRTQRGVHPTEAGELLDSHVEAVLSRLERAEAELAELAGLRAGSIRLGAFFTAMVYLSAEVAIVLGEQHPGLQIVDDLVDRAEALRKLARGQLDVAIIFEPDFEPSPAPEGIEVITLFNDPIRVLLPARHPLAGRPTVHLDQLHHETWIRPHGGSLARLIDKFINASGATPHVLFAGHGEEPIEAQALVAAGRGISLAHDLNVIINPDQVAVRALYPTSAVRHIQVAYLPGHRSPAITATLNALQQIARRRQAR